MLELLATLGALGISAQFLIIEASEDTASIQTKQKVNHTKGFIRRAIVNIVAAVMITVLFTSNHPWEWGMKGWKIFICYLGMVGSLYWLFFDAIINHLNGYHWSHTGTTATIDKLMKKVETTLNIPWFDIVVKVVLIVAWTVGYIKVL